MALGYGRRVQRHFQGHRIVRRRVQPAARFVSGYAASPASGATTLPSTTRDPGLRPDAPVPYSLVERWVRERNHSRTSARKYRRRRGLIFTKRGPYPRCRPISRNCGDTPSQPATCTVVNRSSGAPVPRAAMSSARRSRWCFAGAAVVGDSASMPSTLSAGTGRKRDPAPAISWFPKSPSVTASPCS